MVTAGASAGVSQPDCLALFRGHPARVAIVTMDSADGPVGFTASSVISASLDPPMLVFGVANTSSSLGAFLAADTVIVHFLGTGHLHLSRQFAASAEHRFAGPVTWQRLPTGEPLLDGVDSWARCAVRWRVPTGDHQTAAVQVVEVRVPAGEAAEPLMYAAGGYHRVIPLASRQRPGEG